MMYVFTALGGAFSALLLYWISKQLYSRAAYSLVSRQYGCKEPPSYPERYPILGLDWSRSVAKSMKEGDLYANFTRMFQQLGRTYKGSSNGNTIIHTMDPRNMQTVLALDFASYGVEPTRRISAEPLIGKGVFTSDGDFWAFSRKLGKPLFTRAQISDFAQWEKHVDQLLNFIPRDGSTVDLLPLLKRTFLDRSTELFFGESIGALLSGSSPNSEAARFLSAFDTCMRGMRERKELGPLYILRGTDKEWKEACAKVHEFVDEHIRKAVEKQKKPSGSESEEEPFIFVDGLLDELHDPLIVRSQLLNIFQAARDSTAISLSNMFFNLARYPDVWAKLRKEALEVSGPLNFEVLKSMRYLQYFIKESMRLSGPTGLCQRICLSRTTLPHGGGPDGTEPILVEKGNMVMINFRAMHTDTDIWGPDAGVFWPERWESARPMWEYLPFIGGPRICPAQQMAMAQCAYVLARFAREFKTLENRDPEKRFVEEVRMLCESRNGIKVACLP